ncbi:MAG: sigma-70 family RNA polymerase sigma factor [Candidatus Zixiibacteriota bacterium]
MNAAPKKDLETREAELWERFKVRGELQAREQLIVSYLPIVKYIARYMANILPDMIFYNDIYGAGIVGLMEAVDNFDPKLGVKFKSYATPRIRGAVLDEIRSLDMVSRSLRQYERTIKNATRKLTGELGRKPNDNEIANETEIPVEKVQKLKNKVYSSFMLEIEKPMKDSESDGSFTLSDLLEAPEEQSSPEYQLQKSQMRKALVNAINNIGERYRLILALYYYEELTQKEIGSLLSVSESRVCQLHNQAISKVKKHLDGESWQT